MTRAWAGPTQLHDITSRKYYLRWRTDHCEGRAHGSGKRGGKTKPVMPGRGRSELVIKAGSRDQGLRIGWDWLVSHD